jgi:hypothetical protein
MATGDAMRLLTLIKQKETYISRLRTLLEQSKKEGASDCFAIHSEMRTAIAQGRELVDRYNEIARLQKEDIEYMRAIAKREEQLALKRIRANLASTPRFKPHQEDME